MWHLPASIYAAGKNVECLISHPSYKLLVAPSQSVLPALSASYLPCRSTRKEAGTTIERSIVPSAERAFSFFAISVALSGMDYLTSRRHDQQRSDRAFHNTNCESRLPALHDTYSAFRMYSLHTRQAQLTLSRSCFPQHQLRPAPSW